jgi:hypothetical protein
MKGEEIDLLKYNTHLKFRESTVKKEIFDPVRRRYVNFSREEFVRQLFIQYLMHEKNISRGRIAVEKTIKTGKMLKRFDLLVYDSNAQPLMIVEFKSPGIKINQEALDQAGLYNFEIMAPLLAISNGKSNYFFEIDFENRAFKPVFGYTEKLK